MRKSLTWLVPLRTMTDGSGQKRLALRPFPELFVPIVAPAALALCRWGFI